MFATYQQNLALAYNKGQSKHQILQVLQKLLGPLKFLFRKPLSKEDLTDYSLSTSLANWDPIPVRVVELLNTIEGFTFVFDVSSVSKVTEVIVTFDPRKRATPLSELRSETPEVLRVLDQISQASELYARRVADEVLGPIQKALEKGDPSGVVKVNTPLLFPEWALACLNSDTLETERFVTHLKIQKKGHQVKFSEEDEEQRCMDCPSRLESYTNLCFSCGIEMCVSCFEKRGCDVCRPEGGFDRSFCESCKANHVKSSDHAFRMKKAMEAETEDDEEPENSRARRY